MIEALKFGILAVDGLPEGKNKLAAKANLRSIASRLPRLAIDRAIELAEAWEPLYQEKSLMGDTPE